MNDSQQTNLEKMNKRRVLMEDKRRYIIFYTFGDEPEQEDKRQENSVQSESNEKQNV